MIASWFPHESLSSGCYFAPAEIHLHPCPKNRDHLSYLVGLRRSIELQQYGRQYVGFVKDGKQYIYGNFFKGERESIHAASVPVVICDGGETFLGNRKFPGFQDVRGYPV
jgi:hypothetical protein